MLAMIAMLAMVAMIAMIAMKVASSIYTDINCETSLSGAPGTSELDCICCYLNFHEM